MRTMLMNKLWRSLEASLSPWLDQNTIAHYISFCWVLMEISGSSLTTTGFFGAHGKRLSLSPKIHLGKASVNCRRGVGILGYAKTINALLAHQKMGCWVGTIKVEDCGVKCSRDCKCLGYFYLQETSRCWLSYDLKTLTKVANSTQMGFTKVPDKSKLDSFI